MSKFTEEYRWTSPNAKPDTPATVGNLLFLRDRTADRLDTLDARLRALEAKFVTTTGTIPAEPAPEKAPDNEFDPALVERCADAGCVLQITAIAILRLLRAEGRLCEPEKSGALVNMTADRDYGKELADKRWSQLEKLREVLDG